MNKTFALIIFLAVSFSACSPQIEEVGIEAARTAAAATLDAQLELARSGNIELTAEAVQLTLQAKIDSLATENAGLALQLEQTQIAQSTFSAIEPSLKAPSGANCRVGPASGFARITEVSPGGESLNIVARSSSGDWWQVKPPALDGGDCWIFWASDLTFEGDVFSLPLVEGPRLPTNTLAPTRPPGISVRFAAENTCEGTKFAMIEITNTGPETYESAVVRLIDVASGTQIARSDGNNEFLSSSASCPKGNSNLGPGQSAFLGIRVDGASSGALLRVSVRVCTENGYAGNCVSRNTQFTK